ncbi:ABC transporter ATP-binding protein [Nonomuraea lactucae]|uniref:ABC transporter ATP-binding protein n=1 Tax=Nonomuraea lactucae TaxID=2249762 RepID=UPI000DE1F616|nr:ABC transporter ATP-binding protein [Nonomuraea lactucae]
MTPQPTPPTDAHGIRIKGVTKVYPGQPSPAADDISLDIAPGEFMTFLGPSGSGKTTMLSMIAGLTSLSSGGIWIDGQDISRLKPHKRNLGVVFQQYALFPHLSVAKNVAFPLEQRRVPKDEIHRRVREVLDLVHLGPFAERLPRQLSGGQQQRVALARAVVYEPRALLMDEPLGALDKKLRDQLRGEIARMHRELKMTFIFVTHDQEEALTLSDRIAVFNEGRVEQLGTPTELYEHPATLFVAQFIGESNTFTGTLNRADAVLDCGAFTLRADPGDTPVSGTSSVVVVRPERLTLHPGDTPVRPDHNVVDAVVTEILYVGDHHRIGLRFPDGGSGSAVCSVAEQLPALPGRPVQASWDPEHQTVVPAHGADRESSGPELAEQPVDAIHGLHDQGVRPTYGGVV